MQGSAIRVRRLGKLVDLALAHGPSNTVLLDLARHGIDLFETVDGRLDFGLPLWFRLQLPMYASVLPLPVASICYRAEDDRGGVGTKSKEIEHLFENAPLLGVKNGGLVLEGSYRVGPAGIEG